MQPAVICAANSASMLAARTLEGSTSANPACCRGACRSRARARKLAHLRPPDQVGGTVGVGDGTAGTANPSGTVPRRDPQRPKHSHVGRLHAEGVPVLEADVAKGSDRLDREVPLRCLLRGGPQRVVVRVYFQLAAAAAHERTRPSEPVATRTGTATGRASLRES